MPTRRDFILESGGIEYHALRYQPDTQPEEPMTTQKAPELDIGAAGATSECISWDKRKLVFTCTFHCEGDDRVNPIIETALIQMIAARMRDGETEDFTATNGVRIRVSYPGEWDDSTMPPVPTGEDYVIEQIGPDGTAQSLSFRIVPPGHTLTVKHLGQIAPVEKKEA